METKSAREVNVALKVELVTPCPDGLSRVACLICGESLDIHQPDPNAPDRMLGTCENCGRWHLIDCRSEEDLAIVTLLPGPYSSPLSGRYSA